MFVVTVTKKLVLPVKKENGNIVYIVHCKCLIHEIINNLFENINNLLGISNIFFTFLLTRVSSKRKRKHAKFLKSFLSYFANFFTTSRH